MASINGYEERDASQNPLTEFESRLLRVLGLILVQERQQTEQIGLLSRAGFRPVEIAVMLGTTPNTVNVELSNQRRARSKKQTKKAKE